MVLGLSFGIANTINPDRASKVFFQGSNSQDLQLLKLKQLIARTENGFPPERQNSLQTLAKNLLALKKELILNGIEFLKLLGRMPTNEENWKAQLTRIKTKLTQENQLDVSQVFKTPLSGPKETIQSWLNEFMAFIAKTPFGKNNPMECLQYRMQYPHPNITQERHKKLSQLSSHLSESQYHENDLEGIEQNLMTLAQLPITASEWDHLIKDLVNQDPEETTPLNKLLKQNGLENFLPAKIRDLFVSDFTTLTDTEQVNEMLSELNDNIYKEFINNSATININPYVQKPTEDVTKISSVGTFKNNSDQTRKMALLVNYCDDTSAPDKTMAFMIHFPLKGGKNSSLTVIYGGRSEFRVGGKYLTGYNQMHIIFEHLGEKKSVTLESREPTSSSTDNDELDAFHDSFLKIDNLLPELSYEDDVEELLLQSKRRVAPKYTLNLDPAGIVQFKHEESIPGISLLPTLSTKGGK
jgi:hypothetical protein